MATATATATVSLSDLAGQRVQFHFEHPSFFVLAIQCTVEESARGTVTLWVYDIGGTKDKAMMVLHGNTPAEPAEYEGQVYYRVKLN